jgi:hypothetical protein
MHLSPTLTLRMLVLESRGTMQEPLEILLRDYLTHVRAGGNRQKPSSSTKTICSESSGPGPDLGG